MTTEYFELLDAVEQYYGSGSDQWLEIAKYGITSDKAESILSQVPGVNIVKNSNGKIRSYNFNTTENVVSSAETAVNSNTSPILKSFDVPANTGLETVTTSAGETVTQMTFKSGVSQAGNFVFGEILPAVGAAAVGISLGKTIDKLLYEINPNFWDEHGMDSLNPDTWNDITSNDTLEGRIFNTVFGLNPDGTTQAYLDENALAYMSLYLQIKGIFSSKDLVNINNDSYKSGISRVYNLEQTNLYRYEISSSFKYLNYEYIVSNNSNPVYYMWLETSQKDMMPYFVSKSAFTLKVNVDFGTKKQTRTAQALHTQKNDKDIYYMCNATGNLNGFNSLATSLNTSLVSTIYNTDNEQKFGNNNNGVFNYPYDALIYYMLIYIVYD